MSGKTKASADEELAADIREDAVVAVEKRCTTCKQPEASAYIQRYLDQCAKMQDSGEMDQGIVKVAFWRRVKKKFPALRIRDVKSFDRHLRHVEHSARFYLA